MVEPKIIMQIDKENGEINRLQEELTKVKISDSQFKKKIEDNQVIITDLVKNKQEKSTSKCKLYQTILELRNEVNQLKRSKK